MRRWFVVIGVVALLRSPPSVQGRRHMEMRWRERAGDVRPGPGGQGATQIVMQDGTFQPGAQVDAGVLERSTPERRAVEPQLHSTDLNVSTGPMKPGTS
jgi:hypothetical protein